jgi:hypothetical protein
MFNEIHNKRFPRYARPYKEDIWCSGSARAQVKTSPLLDGKILGAEHTNFWGREIYELKINFYCSTVHIMIINWQSSENSLKIVNRHFWNCVLKIPGSFMSLNVTKFSEKWAAFKWGQSGEFLVSCGDINNFAGPDTETVQMRKGKMNEKYTVY